MEEQSDPIAEQNEKAVYYFSGGFGEGLEPNLEVVKSWSDGQQTLKISTYDTLESALEAESELFAIQENEGLEPAMQQAERMAATERTLDPARADGRLFTEGPPDPFTTLRETEIESIQYTYEVAPQPQGTYELQSLKIWHDEVSVGMQLIALGEYDRPGDANREREMLRELRDTEGLQAEMQTVERIAVENNTRRADRVDPRLFTEGPPDPFTTTRQSELEANKGYTFRAGPALDLEAIGEAYSLDLVHVEREGVDYHFSATEFARVTPDDAGYVLDAADKFNHMLTDEGTGATLKAATVWARGHGTEPQLAWQSVDAERLDLRGSAVHPHPAPTSDISDDTEPMTVPDLDW